MTAPDLETRQRLVEASARLFSARGFSHVTVREICTAAGANVAAVNYHFRDKLGLYTEVVRTAVAAMRETSEAAQHGVQHQPPEERLRTYVRVFLQRVVRGGRDSWIHQLMAREMAEPTPALDIVVEEALRPRISYLAGIVAELLECGPDDARVIRSVASIQSQFIGFMPNPVGTRLFPNLKVTSESIDAAATHITEFSLAGIRAVAGRPLGAGVAGPATGLQSPP